MSPSKKQRIFSNSQSLMNIIRTRPDYLTDKDAIEVLSKAAINGNSILRQTGNESEGSEDVSMQVLCDYAQFLLDFSYAIELKVVNDEFGGDCKENIRQVFNHLDEALNVIKPVCDNQREGDSGEKTKLNELLECIYWRKGALLYMYCHTAYHNQSTFLTSQTLKKEFVTCAKEGVTYLAFDMRKARKEETTHEYDASDEQILDLIKQGIFSDVNMLSLMYSSDMCYWITLMDDCTTSTDITFNPRTLGVQLASQYISIANGPLKESRWNIEQAVKICKHLES